jgi:hypothetical protein
VYGHVHGVGTTGDEEFLAWEPHSHMGFRFNNASTGSIAAFAEDYRITPTAGGCHLNRRPTGDVVDVPEVSLQPARLLDAHGLMRA